MNYITTKEAATICGVSQVTIQNLCRRNALRYKKSGAMYLVCEEDVLQHKATINSIHETEQDIDALKEELLLQNKELSTKKALVEQELNQAGFHKGRIEALYEASMVILESIESNLEALNQSVEYNNLSEMGLLVFREVLAGKTFEEIAREQGRTPERIRQIWNRALKYVAHLLSFSDRNNQAMESDVHKA